MNRVLKFAVSLSSRIYTYELTLTIKRKINIVYSEWISMWLGEVGDNTFFSRPLILQGKGLQRIKIGKHSWFGHDVILGCWKQSLDNDNREPLIIIGDYCNIGDYCHISAINGIIIGDGLLTGRFVYIGDNSHGGLSTEEADIRPVKRRIVSKGKITIGKNVWIGDKVSVLGNVTIGDNVIIGAGSIVTSSIPANCIAAGAPAKIVRRL